METQRISTDLLVIGAGISGMSAALEAAEAGLKVTLIEKRPYVGGRVAQLNQYFPKLCPPGCGMEINTKRLKDNPNIELLTLTEVTEIKGEKGDYQVSVRTTPRYVKNTATESQCENAAKEMTVEIDNEFNYGLNKTKALYLPYNNAFPMRYVFDKDACTADQLKEISEQFADVIDLEQQVETKEFAAKAIVWAVGWNPYDADRLESLGYKEHPQVITNVEMERLASPSGPTDGKILIPGSDKAPQSVAFVQCAGSRDEDHLEYCSSICCLASMKQARYIREQYPESDVHIFYIDLRAYGIMEDFEIETESDEKIQFHRGKVAKVAKEHGSEKVIVEAEDTLAGHLNQVEVDLVVLATGMKPNTANNPLINQEQKDSGGFVITNGNGSIGCGVCTRPKDVSGSVQEATAAALRAIHIIKEGK